MLEFFRDMGCTNYDIALLVLCPLGAAIGSFAHTIILLINPQKIPRPGQVKILNQPADILGRFGWLSMRMILGLILGIVIALYFVGAIQHNITTLAKLAAFSILAGYSAPKLWVSQERVIADNVISSLKHMLPTAEKLETSAVNPLPNSCDFSMNPLRNKIENENA